MRDRVLKLPAKSAKIVRLILAVVVGYGVMATAIGLAQPPAQPDSAAPVETKHSGCVMRPDPDKDTLVINTATVCAKLTGKLAADIAGHEVDLTGVLTAGSRTGPASISVSSVGSVGKSCSSTCSLLPPKTRGLGKGNELPGKEGGTPGLVSPQ